MRRASIKLFAAAAFFLFLAPQPIVSGFKKPKLNTYSVEGIASVKDRNFENARIEAYADAMGNALRLAIGFIGGVEIFTEKKEQIEQFINNNYEKFIHEYRVLNETIEDEYFNVTMSVTIFTESIEEELRNMGLSSITAPPLILVLMDEKTSPIYSKENFLTLFSISEDAIIKSLTKEGWNVIGRTNVSMILYIEDIIAAFTGDIEKIVYLGEELNADVVILGTTRIVTAEPGSKPDGTMIELTVRAVSVENEFILGENRVIGVSKVKEPVLASAQALRDSGAKAALFLSDILQKEFETETEESPFHLLF